MAASEQAEKLWMEEGDELTSSLARRVEQSRREREDASHVLDEARRTRERLSREVDEVRDSLASALERAATGGRGRSQRPLSAKVVGPVPVSDEDVPLLDVREPETSFDELVLATETRSLCEEIVHEHRNKGRLASYGLRPRRRLLLAGPSGTGKTRTAEALAHALGVPVIRVKLSAVVSSYLGQTARHIERILEFSSRGSWVVSFDEFDMLASGREDSDHGEMRRVATVLLQQLETYASDNLVVATTNHADLLDSAIWRRFDEVLVYRRPNQKQITHLLKLKLRRIKYQINQEQAAKALSGLSHAQVEAICLDAMRAAVLDGDKSVSTEDLLRSASSRKRRFKEAGQSLG
ncbi:ATP-binding protein [Streptomyces sp. NPDC003717]|uniref:AAA family ATPase n=1 Tax=Streptomyces sp. NPDC003717 TaxID=3154276 RepID=UPI0033B0739F